MIIEFLIVVVFTLALAIGSVVAIVGLIFYYLFVFFFILPLVMLAGLLYGIWQAVRNR